MLPLPLETAEIESILEEMESRQEGIFLGRSYFNGNQPVYLNDRAREYLGIHEKNTFRFNVCRTIVTALADEIRLTGFDTDEEKEGKIREDGEEQAPTRPVAEWLEELYSDNQIDSMQTDLHEATFSDSEGFLIVEWDEAEGKPKIIFNPAFVDSGITVPGTNAQGDGTGVFMIYQNDDPSQELIAAVKRWPETVRTGDGVKRQRLRATIYYPDHFERWVFDTAGVWEHFVEDTGEIDGDEDPILVDWEIDNTDEAGEPLGIPVFHFKNKGLRPEHWDGIPMQDAINKTLVDVLAAGDLTAFQSFFGFGFYPTTDGKEPNGDASNLMRMGPAQFNGTLKKPSDASLQVIQGQDSTFLMTQFKDMVLATAQITDTPADRFIVTAAIASDKTLKEQERGLRKKAKNRRDLLSDPWIAALDMARKLANVYGSAGLSEEVAIFPVWEHSETLEELKEKRETLEIPIEQLWREAGYTEAQIEQMRLDPSYRVKFEAELWAGANAASLNGVPLELYLARVGIPKEEIKKIVEAIANQSGVTGEEL